MCRLWQSRLAVGMIFSMAQSIFRTSKLSLTKMLLGLTLVGTALVGCAQYHRGPKLFIDSSEMTWIVQKQMAKYRHEKTRRLKLEHSRFEYYTGTPYMHLEISSQSILEVTEARYLIVDFVEDLLKGINLNPIIAAQLPSTFTADQLDIEINFESYLGEYVDPFYVGCIELKCGMVYYNAFDLKDQNRYSWHSRLEPYATAREVAVLERAAEKEFVEEHTCYPPIIDEMYVPIESRDCINERRF